MEGLYQSVAWLSEPRGSAERPAVAGVTRIPADPQVPRNSGESSDGTASGLNSSESHFILLGGFGEMQLPRPAPIRNNRFGTGPRRFPHAT